MRSRARSQEFYHCRKEERVYNGCVFEKLVRPVLLSLVSSLTQS